MTLGGQMDDNRSKKGCIKTKEESRGVHMQGGNEVNGPHQISSWLIDFSSDLFDYSIWLAWLCSRILSGEHVDPSFPSAGSSWPLVRNSCMLCRQRLSLMLVNMPPSTVWSWRLGGYIELCRISCSAKREARRTELEAAYECSLVLHLSQHTISDM